MTISDGERPGGQPPRGGRDKGRFTAGNAYGRGRTPLVARAARNLAVAVRERVSPEIMVAFNVAIAAGHSPVLVEDEDGELDVMWSEDGAVPSLDARQTAMRWLSDRGHGQAPQQMVIEADIRARGTYGPPLDLGSLAPAVLLAVRDALRLNVGVQGALPEPPPPPSDDATEPAA